VEDGTVTIEFEGDRTFHVSRTESPESLARIEAAFAKVTGASVRVRARLARTGGAPAPGAAGPESVPPAEGGEAKPRDGSGVIPLVEEVIRTFGGEVLDEKDPFAGD
jgi:hypothetical protein